MGYYAARNSGRRADPGVVACFGLIWILPPTAPRALAYAGWVAGGIGLAYLMHRRRPWLAIAGGIALTLLFALALAGPRHAFTALWMLSANYGVDPPFPAPAYIPLVILNPTLALALTLARWRREGEGQGAQRGAQRAV